MTIRRGMLVRRRGHGNFRVWHRNGRVGHVVRLPEMRSRLQMTLAQQGTMFLLLFLGIFIATLMAGPSSTPSATR